MDSLPPIRMLAHPNIKLETSKVWGPLHPPHILPQTPAAQDHVPPPLLVLYFLVLRLLGQRVYPRTHLLWQVSVLSVDPNISLRTCLE